MIVLHRLTMLGAIGEVTGCDAGFIESRYGDWIMRLYPLCAAILRKRERDIKKPKG